MLGFGIILLEMRSRLMGQMVQVSLAVFGIRTVRRSQFVTADLKQQQDHSHSQPLREAGTALTRADHGCVFGRLGTSSWKQPVQASPYKVRG